MATARKPRPTPTATPSATPAKPTKAPKPAKPAAKRSKPAKLAKPAKTPKAKAAATPAPAADARQLDMLEGTLEVVGADSADAATTGAVALDVIPPKPSTAVAVVKRGKRIVADELVDDRHEDAPHKRGRGRPPVVVATDAWHERMVMAIGEGQHAAVTMLDRMHALLNERYPDRAPTYEEYMFDQKALAQVAKAKGLSSNQWLRKPFAQAVKERFKALPVQMTAEAVRKRVARQAQKMLALQVKEAQAQARAAKGLPPVEPAEEAATTPAEPGELRAQLSALIDAHTLPGLLDTLSALMKGSRERDVQEAGQAIHELLSWVAPQTDAAPPQAEVEAADETEPAEDGGLGAWPYPRSGDIHFNA